MSEMVERVAKAIFDATDPISGDQIAAARAAIAAMRQPTMEMVEKGNDAARDHMEMDGDESSGYYPVAGPGLAVATINAMIDEALRS